MNEFIKNKAKGFEMTPRESNWEHIENVLSKKKKKRGIIWLLVPVALLLGTGIGLFINIEKDQGKNQIAEQSSVNLVRKNTTKDTKVSDSRILKPESTLFSNLNNLVPNPKAFHHPINSSSTFRHGNSIGNDATTTRLEKNKITPIQQNDTLLNNLSMVKYNLQLDSTEILEQDTIFKTKTQKKDLIKPIITNQWLLTSSIGFGVGSLREYTFKGNAFWADLGIERGFINNKLKVGLVANYSQNTWNRGLGNQSTVGTALNDTKLKGYGMEQYYSGTQKQFKNKITKVGILLYAKTFLLNKNKLSLSILSGIGVQKQLFSQVVVQDTVSKNFVYIKDKNPDKPIFNPFVYQLRLAIPLEYHLSQKISLGFSPTLNLSLNPDVKYGEGITTNYYGISTNFSYCF